MSKALKLQVQQLQAENEQLAGHTGHAFLSPSFAHTGLHCPASALRCFQMKQRVELFREIGAEFYGLVPGASLDRYNAIMEPDDEASRDGTALHTVFEVCVREQKTKKKAMVKLIKERIADGTLSERTGTDEFIIDRLHKCVLEQLDLMQTAEWIQVEGKIKVKGLPEFGTVDLTWLDTRILFVRDLKTGQNVVESKNCEQLVIYSIGVLDQIGWHTVDEVRIKILGLRWEVEEWVVSTKKLAKFKKDVLLPAFFAAYGINPEAIAGDWCHYCEAKMNCGAWQEKFHKYLNTESFDNLDLSILTTPEKVDLYRLCKQAENLAKYQLAPNILRKFEGFGERPKITRVSGRKTVTWTDPQKAAKKLAKKVGGKKELYKQTMKTPKELIALTGDEKAVKKYSKTVTGRPYLKV